MKVEIRNIGKHAAFTLEMPRPGVYILSAVLGAGPLEVMSVGGEG